MEKEFEERLEKYLSDNGAKIIPSSNKEKLEILKKIVFNGKIDIDIADLRNANNKENGIIDTNYIDKIQNLEVNVSDGLYYICIIRGIIREEKRLERNTKIKRFFKLK